MTEQLRWAMGHPQQAKLCVYPNLSPIPGLLCGKKIGNIVSTWWESSGLLLLRVDQPLLWHRLCGEEEVPTQPGLARGSCQQVKLARAPVASCLSPTLLAGLVTETALSSILSRGPRSLDSPPGSTILL